MQYAQKLPALFQHTAARRRLVAGQRQAIQDQIGFNTQPPEGGWCFRRLQYLKPRLFQHTAARKRLEKTRYQNHACGRFQHTAARRRLEALTSKQSYFTKFQHTAARRRLVSPVAKEPSISRFQHTAARRRLDTSFNCVCRL